MTGLAFLCPMRLVAAALLVLPLPLAAQEAYSYARPCTEPAHPVRLKALGSPDGTFVLEMEALNGDKGCPLVLFPDREGAPVLNTVELKGDGALRTVHGRWGGPLSDRCPGYCVLEPISFVDGPGLDTVVTVAPDDRWRYLDHVTPGDQAIRFADPMPGAYQPMALHLDGWYYAIRNGNVRTGEEWLALRSVQDLVDLLQLVPVLPEAMYRAVDGSRHSGQAIIEARNRWRKEHYPDAGVFLGP